MNRDNVNLAYSGKKADLIIIDDPMNDALDGYSSVKAFKDWYGKK